MTAFVVFGHLQLRSCVLQRGEGVLHVRLRGDGASGDESATGQSDDGEHFDSARSGIFRHGGGAFRLEDQRQR